MPSTREQDAFLVAVFGIPQQLFSALGGAPPRDAVKLPNEPDLTPEQRTRALNVSLPEYREVYDAALQGTSGSGDVAKSTETARAIAEEAVATHDSRVADLTQEQRDAFLKEYDKFFLEAVQGLSGGSGNPKSVVAKAHATALASFSTQAIAAEQIEWAKATLPQRMAADCKPVHGKVPGPKNHLLCATHGHVLDVDKGTVIAHSVDEYKKGQIATGDPTVGPRPGSNEPVLTADQQREVINVSLPEYRNVYDAALQGTSGSGDATKSTEAARAIGEEAVATHASRVAELTQEQRDAFLGEYEKFFLEAVQGLSGGSGNPKSVVAKAHAAALDSLNKQDAEPERIEWAKATLPQPMAADCKPVHGKVPGPNNHLLCQTHGHVVDIDKGTVIAHSVDEYRKGVIATGNPTVGPRPGSNEPALTPDQRLIALNVSMPEYRKVYDAALQGSSGSGDVAKSTEAARSIAEEAVATHDSRVADLTREQRDAFLGEYEKFFLEAVQGLSGGGGNPKSVVAKAHATALDSLNKQDAEPERIEWATATLPQPMAADCKPVHGKVPGPANHLFCTTHGHVVDVAAGMVIAHSVEEYKSLQRQ